MALEHIYSLISSTIVTIITIVAFILKQSKEARESRAHIQEVLTTLTVGGTFVAKQLEEHKQEFHTHVTEDKSEFNKINTRLDALVAQGAKK